MVFALAALPSKLHCHHRNIARDHDPGSAGLGGMGALGRTRERPQTRYWLVLTQREVRGLGPDRQV